MTADHQNKHKHNGCVCSLAAGLIDESAYAAFENMLKLPTNTTLRLRGGTGENDGDATETNPKAPKTLVKGGTWTADDKNPTADAILIAVDGTILAVGKEADVVKAAGGAAVETVDLAGKFISPAFFEPHMHPTIGGVIHETSVDVYPFSVKDVDDVLAKLAARCKELDDAKEPETTWLTANGYDQALTPPYRAITRYELDTISTTRPIFITSNTLHTGYANTKAMDVVGISEEKHTHSDYRRGEDGKLNGVFVEAALWGFQAAQPPAGPELVLKALHGFLTRAARKGCATVIDAAMGFRKGTLRGDLAAYMQLAREGRLPCRVGLSPVFSSLDDTVEMIKEGKQEFAGGPVYFDIEGVPRGMLSIHAIKFVLDGTNQTATAYQTKPYKIHSGVGEANYETEELRKMVKAVKEAGLSTMMHANGDAAIDQAIQMYEEIYGPAPEGEIYTGKGFRGRIEHCTICREDQVAKMRKLNIVPSFLMQHLLYWGSTYRDKILGPERAERMDPAADCVKHNVVWTMHCDNPVTPIQPLQYVETAVTRVNYYDHKVLGPEQCVSVQEAMKSITINGAIESGLQEFTGSIEVGKSADLVVLGASPFEVKPSEIKSIPVLETWLAGKRVQWD